MGRDKALLPVGGVPMALLAARKLERVCGRASFVGKEAGELEGTGFPFVPDGTDERAALLGLLAALESCPGGIALVLAADVPRVPEEFLAALLDVAGRTGAAAVVPTDGGHPQPLCAAWTSRALPALRAAAAARSFSLRRAVEAAGALVLSEEETSRLPGFVPGAFRNVNTPEEYRALEEENA
jgi:molybdopterin-guanine dinucleotide biosynthesis protein A